MTVNQSIQLIQGLLLRMALVVVLLLGVLPAPAMAAPPNLDTALDLRTAVDRTLTAIPTGFYKVDDVTGLKRLQAEAKAQVVDVREPTEYGAGHIPGAINIPLRALAQHLEQIERDRPVVLYCSSGYRSAMGVVSLHLLGYDNVQGFPPSFVGWKAAGEAIAQP
jgi:rhodanese-related sulfurtransferase